MKPWYIYIHFKVGRPCIPHRVRSPQHVFYVRSRLLRQIMLNKVLKGGLAMFGIAQPEGELGSVCICFFKIQFDPWISKDDNIDNCAVWDLIIPIRSIPLKK